MSKKKKPSYELQTKGPVVYCTVQDETKTEELYLALKDNTLLLMAAMKQYADPINRINLLGGVVKLMNAHGQVGFQIDEVRDGSVVEQHIIWMQQESQRSQWHGSLERATVDGAIPSGITFTGTPSEYELCERLPEISETEVHLQKKNLLLKFRLCSIQFDLRNPQYGDAKDAKRTALVELVDIASPDSKMGALLNDTRTFSDLLKMIGANLFRALPFRPDSAADDDEEDEPFMDHNWSHLAIVYELLMRTVQTQKIDTAVKKKCISVQFVRSLLQLFNSEDNRERDYLKTITHRVYGKLTNRRAHIRKSINNVFYEYIYETQQHNGIAELLEILASIINGFAQPVKQEHKAMLERCLIPLHKLKGVAVYHHQLMYCMTLFAMKDETLPKLVINGLLRFWPCGCSNKELLFLQELDELFEYVVSSELHDFRTPLTVRLVKCISCPHFQVAERTLWLWQNEFFMQLTVKDRAHRNEIFRACFDALYDNAKNHWNEAVKSLSAHILQLYMEEIPDEYDRLEAAYHQTHS